MSEFIDHSDSDIGSVAAALFPEEVAPEREVVEQPVIETSSEAEPESDAIETEADESQPIGEVDEANSEAQSAPIAPPVSWNAEEKDAFNKLPPEVQKVIARREEESLKVTNQRLMEAAEARKAIEAERAAVLQEREQYRNGAMDAATILQRELHNKYQGVDWQGLMKNDPALYLSLSADYNADQAKVQYAVNQHQAIAAQEAQQRQVNEQKYIQNQLQVLTEKYLPEVKSDPTRLQAIARNVTEYLGKEYQFTEREMSELNDARVFAIVHKAAMYDKAQKEAASKRSVTPQRVITPGTSNNDGPSDNSKAINSLKAKAIRSGKDTDAQALIEALL